MPVESFLPDEDDETQTNTGVLTPCSAPPGRQRHRKIQVSWPIDGLISCEAYVRCHLPLRQYSQLCEIHYNKVVDALRFVPIPSGAIRNFLLV